MTFVVPCGSINIDRVVMLCCFAVIETPWGTAIGQSMMLAPLVLAGRDQLYHARYNTRSKKTRVIFEASSQITTKQ
jgi:hypothetical protein